ncbi:glutathionylspermidine synthase family protein [Portibacter lacus]|uniref:Glutathionylspermidine synthase n=1 Tax=Portibacter lacus TaxID=1099794 RepID=A0AA37SLP8_9BACT|nr:glutathionylspermidine synthase family protein [Portibacter lacus]GLR16621.1 glutathionylspermidine synthase [Portibacter lacus]
MADRTFDLKRVPEREISQAGFDWYLGQEYLVAEALILEPEEVDNYVRIAEEAIDLFNETVDRIIEKADWDKFAFPILMREMIQHSWDRGDMHLLARFDLSGGILGMQSKIYELNADTPTMLPETVVFQPLFKDEIRRSDFAQFNNLREELTTAFKELIRQNPDREPTLLVTSLGYEEDVLNAQVVEEIAKEAGFTTQYADLENIVFEDDGVYVDFEDGSDMRYEYMYKLVPWEFIMYEEPELLEILHRLQLEDLVYILNPAYTAIMQSKAILPYVSANFKEDFILKSSFSSADFNGEPHVEKVIFGRLGENVKVMDNKGTEVAKNDGDFGNFEKIYQAFSPLYQDDDGDFYQPGIYVVDKVAAAISFRRCDHIIIDDDAEFIPHLIAPE